MGLQMWRFCGLILAAKPRSSLHNALDTAIQERSGGV
jgi:hypothetical protein